ncbi:MAG: DsbA family oxidoreductase [Dysgonamonadaceae bacterium]
MTTDKIIVEVWSDIMCPYCYIGKNYYEKALSQFEHADLLEIEWKAFQLNPNLPDRGNGYPVTEYLTKTAGMSEDRVNRMFESVKKLSEDAGLKFNLNNSIAANSRDAHRLIKLAKQKGTPGADSKVIGDLGKAYFEDAKDYSDWDLLVSIGKDAGLLESDIQNMLNSDDFIYDITQDIQEAHNLGFDTVPTFLFDRTQAIVGSEPVDLFLKLMNKVYNNWIVSNETKLGVKKGKSCSIDGTCEI